MSKQGTAWIYLLTLALIWGSSFILMKRGLVVFSYTEVAALRLCLAFFSLLPFGYKFLAKIPPNRILALAVIGIVGNGIPAFLFAKSQTQIDSSLAGILNALTPLFTVFIGMLFFKLKMKWPNMLGVAIGLGGAVWLMNPTSIESNAAWYYPLYVVVATLCYAISVNIIKFYVGHLSSIQVTLTGLMFAAPLPLVYLIFGSDFAVKLEAGPVAWEALGYIFLLAAVGTSFSVVLFNELIKLTTPIFASSVTYLIPIVATVWGMLDGERLEMYEVLALGLVLFGVYLVNRK